MRTSKLLLLLLFATLANGQPQSNASSQDQFKPLVTPIEKPPLLAGSTATKLSDSTFEVVNYVRNSGTGNIPIRWVPFGAEYTVKKQVSQECAPARRYVVSEPFSIRAEFRWGTDFQNDKRKTTAPYYGPKENLASDELGKYKTATNALPPAVSSGCNDKDGKFHATANIKTSFRSNDEIEVALDTRDGTGLVLPLEFASLFLRNTLITNRTWVARAVRPEEGFFANQRHILKKLGIAAISTASGAGIGAAIDGASGAGAGAAAGAFANLRSFVPSMKTPSKQEIKFSREWLIQNETLFPDCFIEFKPRISEVAPSLTATMKLEELPRRYFVLSVDYERNSLSGFMITIPSARSTHVGQRVQSGSFPEGGAN